MINLGINNMYVEAGPYGYTLKQKRLVKDSKTGEMKDGFDVISYHGNMEAVLSTALNETVRQKISAREGDVSLDEALREMRELHRAFSEILYREVGQYEKAGESGGD